jgi:hypothetical protein
MNEIVFKKSPKFSYYILFITSSIIGVFLVFYNPLGFSNVAAKGSYIFPLLLFIWLWKNYFFLYKNYVRWNTEIIWIKVNRNNCITIAFEDVSDILFEQDKLIITLKNNQKKVFNLENISLISIERLKRILLKHSKLKR